MARTSGYFLLTAILAAFICGCSQGDGPSTPPLVTPSESASSSEASSGNINHYLWSYNLIYIDVSNLDDIKYEIVPLRQPAGHWNILAWLEQQPCTDCFNLTKLVLSPNHHLLADIRIKHPFANANLTGFDVRGIAMFTGSESFPQSGLTYSSAKTQDMELLNPDGFTSLYNPGTEGHGLEGYMKGKLASAYAPDATLNGYKRFISNDPANTRNAFYAGDAITVTYEIGMPENPYFLVFGYAIDATWTMATKKPVIDPMNDFPISANCPEPWKIEAVEAPIGDGLNENGGQTVLRIDVYDRTGKDTYNPPQIECPYLIDGSPTADWKEDGPGYSRYEVTIENTNFIPGGLYSCLIAVEDKQNDPVGKPWLDLTAYQICSLKVSGPPVAKAKAYPNPQSQNEALIFSDDGSVDPDGGDIVKYEWDWDNDGTFDETGAPAAHPWNTPGEYSVQFRVTDDEGQTDTLWGPMTITITQDGIPSMPYDITPPGLNFTPYRVAVSGHYAYVAAGPNGLHIFDITTPTKPVCKKWVDTGDAFDVVISGDYAYIAAQYRGVVLVAISDPLNAHIVHTVGNLTSSAVVVGGQYAYSIYQNFGLTIIDISQPQSAYVLKTVQYPGQLWNATDLAYSNGYVYVAALFDGMGVVDVDPPQSAHVVTQIKDFLNCAQGVAVSGNYCYIADANEGFRVVDIDPPESANIVNAVDVPGMPVHIAISGPYAYVAKYYAGLSIIDIGSPETAFEAGSVGAGDIYSVDVSNGLAYAACYSNGLEVIDVDPPGSSSVVARLDTVGASYEVAVSSGYAYTADYHGGLQVTDVDPPESASVVSAVSTGYVATAVAVSGTYAYTATSNGLQIIDISTPGNEQWIHEVETPGEAVDVEALNGYAYVVDKENGLQIIDVAPPNAAYVAGTVAVQGEGCAVAMNGGYAYVTSADPGSMNNPGYLQIIDVQSPSTAHVINTVTTEKPALGLAVADGYAYVTIKYTGLAVIDVDPPESACIATAVELYNEPVAVAVSNGYAYVCTGYLDIVDIHTPEAAVHLATSYIRYARDLEIFGNTAYIAAEGRGLRIVKLW